MREDEEEDEEGRWRGKVMSLTLQFETTFFSILSKKKRERAFATIQSPLLKLDTMREKKEGKNYFT